jgi:hypothetical protein
VVDGSAIIHEIGGKPGRNGRVDSCRREQDELVDGR